MLIAKVEDGQVINVSDYREMFPNTSFPDSGPDNQFMIENGCMYVNSWLPYDSNTQKLASVAPYIQIDDPLNPLQWVYTIAVEPLTPEEIEQQNELKRQKNKTQATQLLYETDWTTIPDVGNPSISNPYLSNAADFVTYRNALRQITVYPPITVDEWPVKPDEQWVSTP